ncbi:Imidazole glycerol phosphate synthase hisHF, chloroplastic [Capsicum baccatum]|uniref:Imidazole glycerol phosphate synthase hisHF, chloroplastic n=1 Tax=Capsicum baccatum TaxID=33114 RepID=A0A2G2VKT8_CAPBA|nr:Imidazole glycerol phosphate synthase hisHF, chloroplastic [Capsicum baccatum]
MWDFAMNHNKPPRSASVFLDGSTQVVTLRGYCGGNVRSLRNAIKYLGFDIKDVQTPEDILKAKRLVFPGVHGVGAKQERYGGNGSAEWLICLGLQLLFESSEENGPVKGLGLIPGVVRPFDSSKGIRVPHIGWNALGIAKDTQILDDIGKSHVYFVHSYRAMPSDENREWISSTCKYGDDNFIASIQRGNVHAVQFHPEKSGGIVTFSQPI